MGWPLPGIGACTGKRDSEQQKTSQRKFGHVLTMQSVRSSSRSAKTSNFCICRSGTMLVGWPHAIFFTKKEHSILGSGHLGLGMASHGCIRLWLPCRYAQLVQADGMANTK